MWLSTPSMVVMNMGESVRRRRVSDDQRSHVISSCAHSCARLSSCAALKHGLCVAGRREDYLIIGGTPGSIGQVTLGV
jgi:Zn-dependent alcohol dehydrogenase